MVVDSTTQEFEKIAEFLRNPGGLTSAGERLVQVVQPAITASGDSAIAEFGPEIVPAVDIGVSVLDLSTGWIVLLALSLTIILGKVIEATLLYVFSKLPWFVGSGTTGFIKMVFKPLDNLELWVGGKLADISTQLLITVLKFMQAVMVFILGGELPQPSTVSTSVTDHLQHEIAATNARLDHLETLITLINYEIHGINVAGTGVATLEQRVSALEHQNTRLVHDINVLHSNDNRLAHDIVAIDSTLRHLSAALTSTRAITMNVQDILTGVSNTTQTLTKEMASISPIVDANTRMLHTLKPLDVLLIAGSVGLRNLQKLERKPCQCPENKDLSNPQGAAFGAYEFLTNG